MSIRGTVLATWHEALARPAGHVRLSVVRLGAVGLVGLILISLLYLSLASSNAALSYQLKKTTDEIAQLQQLKADKLRKWSQLTDPARLEAMARAKGYREPPGTLDIGESAPATQSVTGHPSPTTRPGTPDNTTDWWEIFTAHIITWIEEPPSPRP